MVKPFKSDICAKWNGIFCWQFPVLFLGKTIVDEFDKQEIYKVLGFLEKYLEGNTWVAGDKLTVADIACVASISSIAVSLCNSYLSFNSSFYTSVTCYT